MGHKTIVTVLVASMIVAGALAWQAVAAARQRQAVSEAMVRQYAELAAWEFSREARKNIDEALTRTLAAEVHPGRHASGESCDCIPLQGIQQWFEVGSDRAILNRAGELPPALRDGISRLVTAAPPGSVDAGVRLWRLSAEDSRIVAVRWEPHLGSSGRHIGLIMPAAVLEPVLSKTLQRTTLLPPLLVAGRDARRLVDLRVHDSNGATVFASPDTRPGPHPVDADLFPASTIGLRVNASMTPAFVMGLGPEHGAGPGQGLVLGLLLVNGLLVAVGIWQLARERELARLRSDFVAGVSHELRTPLAQIRMFAETLLLDRIRNPREGRRALEIIGQETRRLSQLVENVLYFHRHQRAPHQPPAEIVDLVPLAREVVDGFAPLAGSRRVQLECHAAMPELLVRGSADGLRQVILNLLDNAVKFGPAGQVVGVILDVHDNEARIAVEDGGPGVAASDRRRIFDAFQRGRSSHGAGGAGIGLAVVRQIVHGHLGRVAVEPADTGGARFVVMLPLVKALAHDLPVSLAG